MSKPCSSLPTKTEQPFDKLGRMEGVCLERSGAQLDYSGTHLLADLFGCTGLDDVARVEAALRDAVAAGGATLLELRLHGFGDGQGVTGVALLAESHISIHTWPERDYAAADIFLCGRRHDLDAALAALATGLGATRWDEQRVARGFSIDHVPAA